MGEPQLVDALAENLVAGNTIVTTSGAEYVIDGDGGITLGDDSIQASELLDLSTGFKVKVAEAASEDEKVTE